MVDHAKSTEIEKPNRFSDDELRNVESWEAITALVGSDIKSAKIEKPNRFSDDELRNVESWEAITALVGSDIKSATEMGSGFAVLDKNDKDRICGVPIVFLSWSFNPGDYGIDFVSANVCVMDKTGKVVGKYVVNDGGSGICRQLREWSNRTGDYSGLFAPNGLRRSDYEYTDEKGNQMAASTYYIDTSPAA